ncbi:MAG TPA: hypothetical protein VIK81_01840 [Patescibacteria group bacterium]
MDLVRADSYTQDKPLCAYGEPHSMCHARAWESHLTRLYDAIENNDLPHVLEIEHLLTNDEKCIACAYSLKAKGEVRTALDSYLLKQKSIPTTIGNSWFLSWRIFVFSLLLAFATITVAFLRHEFFGFGFELSQITIMDFFFAIFFATGVVILLETR